MKYPFNELHSYVEVTITELFNTNIQLSQNLQENNHVHAEYKIFAFKRTQQEFFSQVFHQYF